MNELLPAAKANCVVIPKQSPNFADDTAPTIIWEHGRRNFGLRDDGVLPAVLPVTDGSEMCGVGIFTGAVDDTIASSSFSIAGSTRSSAATGLPTDSQFGRSTALIWIRPARAPASGQEQARTRRGQAP